jgi:hypothetical protein
MKSLILAAIYAAIVTQSEGCDIIKRLTDKEWQEVPVGTRRFMIIAGIWGAAIIFLILRYLLTAPNDRTR